MVFSSHFFLLVFLPVVLLGYFAIARVARDSAWAMRWLFAASLVFYGWWSWIYLCVLLGSILGNFLIGRAIVAQTSPRGAAALMWTGITGNLALLGYYKYANFLVTNANLVLSTDWHLGTIVLPLAISFHTFQQIAYLVEVRRGNDQERSLERYLLFVSFFPQLIAGPIVRHAEVAPQFTRLGKSPDKAADLAAGLSIFIIGLAKKTLLADPLAPLANATFNAASAGYPLSAPMVWLGVLAYTLQLYFDFSGYSEMAVGLARMLGVRLPINFWSPYRATNIAIFWRRWHMTLSRFLRDYLYIPMGGNRRGVMRTYVNLMVTMALGGLWHGASWNFVIWGVYHGLLLSIHRLFSELGWRPLAERSRLGRHVAVAITFLAVTLGWVWFRAADLASAERVFLGLFGLGGSAGVPFDWAGWLHVGALLVVVLAVPNTWQLMADAHPVRGPEGTPPAPTRLRWNMSYGWGVALAAVGAWAILSAHRYTEFLYFQF